MRVFALILILGTIPACTPYDPVPPGGMITCHTGQPSEPGAKGCG